MGSDLAVWLFDRHVGTLSIAKGRLHFIYEPTWRADSQATALSHSLPLQQGSFDDDAARPFFAGLLPEGQMRRLIAKKFQVSDRNDFALLDNIGGECAGAVTFIELGHSLPSRGAVSDVQWLSDEELIATLDELPQRPMLAGDEGLRLSLAGAQDKLPVVFDGQRVGLPRNGTPSSHILKPAIHGVADSVYNEGFCMRLAELTTLAPAKARVHTVLGRSFLLVERYDRLLMNDRQYARIHQEDFCQALGVMPDQKYQNEGGPDLAQCFELLRQATRPNAPQVLRLLDYVIFNVLVGNHDAHAKNFSLLYSGARPVLAPGYDLLSTAVYAELTPKMAMKIGGKYKFVEGMPRHWDLFAESAGLAKAETRKRVLQLATALPQLAKKLERDQTFSGNATIKNIISLIEKRCTTTIQRLALSGNLEAEA